MQFIYNREISSILIDHWSLQQCTQYESIINSCAVREVSIEVNPSAITCSVNQGNHKPNECASTISLKKKQQQKRTLSCAIKMHNYYFCVTIREGSIVSRKFNSNITTGVIYISRFVISQKNIVIITSSTNTFLR